MQSYLFSLTFSITSAYSQAAADHAQACVKDFLAKQVRCGDFASCLGIFQLDLCLQATSLAAVQRDFAAAADEADAAMAAQQVGYGLSRVCNGFSHMTIMQLTISEAAASQKASLTAAAQSLLASVTNLVQGFTQSQSADVDAAAGKMTARTV
jgi:hypothetical protein